MIQCTWIWYWYCVCVMCASTEPYWLKMPNLHWAKAIPQTLGCPQKQRSLKKNAKNLVKKNQGFTWIYWDHFVKFSHPDCINSINQFFGRNLRHSFWATRHLSITTLQRGAASFNSNKAAAMSPYHDPHTNDLKHDEVKDRMYACMYVRT